MKKKLIKRVLLFFIFLLPLATFSQTPSCGVGVNCQMDFNNSTPPGNEANWFVGWSGQINSGPPNFTPMPFVFSSNSLDLNTTPDITMSRDDCKSFDAISLQLRLSNSGATNTTWEIYADNMNPSAGVSVPSSMLNSSSFTTITLPSPAFDNVTTLKFRLVYTISMAINNQNPTNFGLDMDNFFYILKNGPSEIDVQGFSGGGSAVSINDGDTSPSTNDGTDFGVINGSSASKNFSVRNIECGPLTFGTTPSITGSGASHFSIQSPINPAGPYAENASGQFTVLFTNPGAPGTYQATVNITNNDSDENPFNFDVKAQVIGPNVTIASSNTPLDESATGIIDYTVSLSSAATSNLTINFSLSGTATSTSDYMISGTGVSHTAGASTGTIMINSGASTGTIQIDPTDEDLFEADETVVITIVSGTGYSPGSPNSASGTITNDDQQVLVNINNSPKAESSGESLDFLVTREGITDQAITVNFSLGGTTSLSEISVSGNNVSYNAVMNKGTVMMDANITSETIKITPMDDGITESNETISVKIEPFVP